MKQTRRKSSGSYRRKQRHRVGNGQAASGRRRESGDRGPKQKDARRSSENHRKRRLAVQADVSKLSEMDKLYAQVAEKLGKIDVLFVNAGVAKFAPLADTSEGSTTSNSTSTSREHTSPFRRRFPSSMTAPRSS